jgi:catechol 2,3-dioxygenase-like lactoylglutathione lyase family enzyme/RimJ/RimL family protein N-acetyltransferase
VDDGDVTGASGSDPTRPLRFEVVQSTLRDGTPVIVRAIRPEDKPLLVDAFDRLSEESRLHRFMAPITELSRKQLRYLTEVDYLDHFAWLGLLAQPPNPPIGVARYVRLADEPTVAEAAVTVVDEYQGRGLGTLMLGLLAVAASAAGIECFRAYVLVENRPMKDILEQLGAESHFDSPGVERLDVPLAPDMLPDSPAAKVLKGVAAHMLKPARLGAVATLPAEMGEDAADAGSTRQVVRSLDHVYYWVADMDRAVAFYRDVLGLSPVRREGGSWAVFDIGGRMFALHGAVEGRPVGPGGAAAVFDVDDLDAAKAILAGRGVEFDHEGDVAGYGRFASFRDPDGNAVQIIEYARH